MSDIRQTDQVPERTSGYAFTFYPVRWKPYSPKSQQFKSGRKGRWQKMNEYAGWENCEAPNHVYETCDLGKELIAARTSPSTEGTE